MEILDINKTSIDFVAKELKRGKIFVAPTDTCYGILGDTRKKTIVRIFDIKLRSKGKSLPIFVSRRWIYDYIDKNANFDQLINNFWPGALTISIRPKNGKKNFLQNVMSSQGTIAVREPDNLFLNKLLDKYQEPLTSTSANISKMNACYSVDELIKQFGKRKNKPDYIIDAGRLPKRKSSSIINAYTLELTRTGEITRHVVNKKIK